MGKTTGARQGETLPSLREKATPQKKRDARGNAGTDTTLCVCVCSSSQRCRCYSSLAQARTVSDHTCNATQNEKKHKLPHAHKCTHARMSNVLSTDENGLRFATSTSSVQVHLEICGCVSNGSGIQHSPTKTCSSHHVRIFVEHDAFREAQYFLANSTRNKIVTVVRGLFQAERN